MNSHAASDSRAGRWIALSLMLVAIAAFVAFWWGGIWIESEDPRVAEIRVMHEEMATKFPPGQAIRSPDEALARVTAMQAVMEKVQALPPELRGRAMMSGMRTFRASMDAKIDEYFTLPVSNRAAFLDVEINQMEMMRSAFGAAGGPPGAGSGSGTGGGPSGGSPSTRPGGDSNRNRPPFPPPNMSEAEAASMRKHMIDGTTPERRARMEEFITAMQRRRGERGLPALPGPP